MPLFNPIIESIGITYDGAGSALVAGSNTVSFIQCQFNGTIIGWTLIADVSGSIVVDVWKTSYASAPPTVANTIAGTDKPTLSSAQKNQDLTLSGWGSTVVTAGDIFAFHIDSATTVTRVNLILAVRRS